MTRGVLRGWLGSVFICQSTTSPHRQSRWSYVQKTRRGENLARDGSHRYIEDKRAQDAALRNALGNASFKRLTYCAYTHIRNIAKCTVKPSSMNLRFMNSFVSKHRCSNKKSCFGKKKARETQHGRIMIYDHGYKILRRPIVRFLGTTKTENNSVYGESYAPFNLKF